MKLKKLVTNTYFDSCSTFSRFLANILISKSQERSRYIYIKVYQGISLMTNIRPNIYSLLVYVARNQESERIVPTVLYMIAIYR